MQHLLHWSKHNYPLQMLTSSGQEKNEYLCRRIYNGSLNWKIYKWHTPFTEVDKYVRPKIDHNTSNINLINTLKGKKWKLLLKRKTLPVLKREIFQWCYSAFPGKIIIEKSYDGCLFLERIKKHGKGLRTECNYRNQRLTISYISSLPGSPQEEDPYRSVPIVGLSLDISSRVETPSTYL